MLFCVENLTGPGDAMPAYSASEATTALTLWEQGVPASKIAAKLGRSRSSVIGFVQRKVGPRTRRGDASARDSKGFSFVRQHKAQIKSQTTPPLAFPPPLVAEPLPGMGESDNMAERIKLIDLPTHEGCRWPIGDPREDPNFGFCGKPQFRGIPGTDYDRSQYCLEHQKRSMRKDWLTSFEKALAKAGVRSP